MAKQRYRKRNSGRRLSQQRDWRFITSIIVGAVIVLAGVGLVIGITVGGANANNRNCPSGQFFCTISNRCEPLDVGCPNA